jgi:leucyl aminopeptidase
MDITDTPDLGRTKALSPAQKSAFPDKLAQQEVLKPALQLLSKKEMRQNLEKFTSFHTRYYKSEYGVQSSNWLFGQVKSIVETSNASHAVSVQQFPHSWGQSSIIATIPGQSNKTVVIGAHQDSINLFFPSLLVR